MSRWRWVTGVGVVAALAGAQILLSLQGEDSVASTTSVSTSLIASTTEPVEVTTTETALTTTTSEEQRRAEVEELLRDLWFGWFDAIYRKDPDALWRVVATTRFYENGVAAMETMEFSEAPSLSGILVSDLEILLDRRDCLVVYNAVDMTQFRGQPGQPVVSVLWPDPRYGFRFATDWQFANDLWIQDCDNLARETTP